MSRRRRFGWLLVLAAGAVGCDPGATVPSPSDEEAAAETPSAIRFTDVTAAAGVDFVHDNAASAERYLPETLGAGVAFCDFDGDEQPDLFFADGMAVSSAFGSGNSARPAGRLYRNRGGGTFEDVTAGAGLGDAFLAMGVAVGDVDADGRPDLFVSGVGAQRLYRNLGDSRFTDVTVASGLEMRPRGGDLGFGTSAAFFDGDRDGRLDLIVGRYVPWGPGTDVRCSPDGTHRTYCTPESYDPAANVYYRNLGDGRFVDATREAGLDRPAGKTLGIAVFDHNSDGWPDLAVANDTDRNHLFVNRGDGTFDEVGLETGLALSVSGATRGAMGIDTGDLDGDGRVDVVIGNFAQELTAIYLATPSGQYRDEAARLGVGLPSLMRVTFGTLAVDLDLDGRLDLAFANGHIEPEIAAYQSSLSYRQPLGVYHNALGAPGGSFVRVEAEAGPLAAEWVGRGLAAADFDGDGDLDLVLTQNGDSARLLRNDSAVGNWLRVRLVAADGSATPYGARLTVVAGGRRIERTLRTGSSYLSASEPVVTFGLGEVAAVDRLEIVWPSGREETVPSPVVNRLHVVREAE